MRWRASCSATNIFRECADVPIAGSWLILFPVEMGFRLVSGIGAFYILVSGTGMSRRLVSGIGTLRIPELGGVAVLRESCDRLYALRVSRAETRLTVYRPLHVLLRSDRPSSGVREDR